jgi:hypothetical protein
MQGFALEFLATGQIALEANGREPAAVVLDLDGVEQIGNAAG